MTAPSLHDADVGISVDNATDVAKASADIILLEKSLTVILNGIYEGRRIYGNILKYMKMALSGNFGNVFSVLIASIFLPFSCISGYFRRFVFLHRYRLK